MKICKKFKPLFDLPKAWGETERLSLLGLNEIDKLRLEELILHSEREDLDKKDREELLSLRHKGLTLEQSKDLDYWIQLGGVTKVSVTGGRESSKTFTSSLASTDRVVNHGYRELYTRYTMKSASKSVIPSFLNRSKALGYDPFLKDTLTSVKCESSGGYVDFSGIKASSGNQSANLKSLEDYCVFTVEEGEEFPTYEEWEKIELSFRSKDVQPFSVFIMNPSTKKFWWYIKNFQEKGVKGGFNGIVGDTLYIHTTYLDLGKKYVSAKNWRKYEAARLVFEEIDKLSTKEKLLVNPKELKIYKYYKYTVLGGWMETAAGVIFEDYDTYDELPEDVESKLWGLDFGYSKDPSALVEVNVAPDDIYLKQHIYETGMLNNALADRINMILGDEESYIIADHARPDLIDDLNRIVAEKGYNFVVLPCDKGPGSVRDGIEKMKDKNIHIHKDSKDFLDEANHYHQIEVINAKGETVYHIVDKDNHNFDAARYSYTKFY